MAVAEVGWGMRQWAGVQDGCSKWPYWGVGDDGVPDMG